MSSDGAQVDLIRAEAAAWLARLRSEAVRPQDQAGFQQWLAQDVRHGDAFEEITGTWDLVGGVPIPRPMRHVQPGRSTVGRRNVLLGAALIAVSGVTAGYWYLQRPETYVTGTGEQRRILLGDGSTVLLDAESQIAVRLQSHRRDIALNRGRAYFEVAPNPRRPFVVSAGGHEIVATGTAFEVEDDAGSVSATLEHGQIIVSDEATQSPGYVLAPGDRIFFANGSAPTRDRPDMPLAMAWRTGRLGFDRETLAAAVAEMNRYSRRPLLVGDPAIGNYAISGLYTAGDNEAFARSVSMLLPIAVDSRPEQIILTAAKKTHPAY